MFARASETLPVPGRDHVLHYEWRARLLHQRGEIEQVSRPSAISCRR